MTAMEVIVSELDMECIRFLRSSGTAVISVEGASLDLRYFVPSAFPRGSRRHEELAVKSPTIQHNPSASLPSILSNQKSINYSNISFENPKTKSIPKTVLLKSLQ